MTGHENIPALQANFRAAVIQAVINAGDNPKDPDIKAQIEILEKKYAIHLEQTGIYISGKNDIPGFRQVVFHRNDITIEWIIVIAVTSDSRLVTGTIMPVNYRIMDKQNPVTTEQAIETLVNLNGLNLKFINERNDFNLHDPGSHDQAFFPTQSPETLYTYNSIKKISAHVNPCGFDPCTVIEIRQFLYHQLEDRLAPARRAIINALDEDILRDMLENNIMMAEQVRILTGGDRVSRDVITARQQAVRTYPILSEIFQKNNMLRNAIDARTSLAKAIADYFDVDVRNVKRLSCLTWQKIGSKPKSSIEVEWMIPDFLHLPDKCFPKNTRQFQQLKVLRNFGKNLYNEDLVTFAERLSKNGNPWKLINRMEQTNVHNVRDAMRFLVKKLLVPAMFNKGGHAAVPPVYRHVESYSTLMSKKMDEIRTCFKVGELLDWSDRYHRNIMRYEDCLDTVSSEQIWPGLFDTLDFGNGMVARELNSAQALKTQGILERHCVGGYLSHVLDIKNRNGKFTLIFSIEKNNTILSTAEIECIQKTDENNGIPHIQAQIRQNGARRNRTPCEDAVRIANQIVARLESIPHEACRTYLDNLNQACLEYNHQSNIDIHVEYCGFDPFDRAMMERAWNELSPALPRRFRRDGLDAFIEHGLANRTSFPETR